MKKIVFFIASLVLFLLPIRGNAAEYDYANITDESSIEEDFKTLQIDIKEYHSITTQFEKWYVVGMSESYLEDYNKLQTYFYLYNPTRYGEGSDYLSTVSNFDLEVTMNGVEQKCSGAKLDYNKEHCLYKVKGFTYDFVEASKIRVSEIQHYNMRGLGITNDSNFFATVNHSKLNGFNVELSFNSCLAIEDYEAVSVQIPKNSNFFEDLKDSFSGDKYPPNNLVFYNFNFPDNIKPDKLLKAVFNYDYVRYYCQTNTYPPQDVVLSKDEIRPQINSNGDYNNDDLGVYTPGTFKYKASGGSTELSFETFVLGNRIAKGEFGYVDMTGLEAKFNYDCSILLGATRSKVFMSSDGSLIGTVGNIFLSRFENIEFIYLEYNKDGIVYRCQVVSTPVDEPIPETPGVKPNFWDKIKDFLINMADAILNALHISAVIPDGGKIALSIGILIIAAWLFKLIIKKILSWVYGYGS